MWPFSVLQIAPTDDERSVKRAYAARLKVTRPEDDPEAFQRLVRARDEALELIRSGAVTRRLILEPDAPPPRPPNAAAEPATKAAPSATADGPPPASPDGSIVMRLATTGALDGSAPADAAGRLLATIEVPDADAAAEPEPEADGRLDFPLPPPSEEEAPSPQPVLVAPPPIEPPQRPPPPPLPPVPPPLPAPDPLQLLGAEMERLTLARNLHDLDSWSRWLDKVEDLPIAERLDLETRLARALDASLAAVWHADDQLATIRLVDQSFGWSHDSRRLARLIQASDRSPLVAAVETLGYRPPPRRDEEGFPLIEPADLEAYLGSAGHSLIAYYAKARERHMLPIGWRWSAFFFPAGWSLARLGPVVPGLVAIGLVAVTGGLFQPIETTAAAGGLVAFLAGLTVLRLVLAAEAPALETRRIGRLVIRADALHPARGDKRRDWLAARRRSGRLLGWTLGAIFFVMVDFYAVSVISEALRLDDREAQEIAGPGHGGFLDRIRVGSYLRERKLVAVRIGDKLDELRGLVGRERIAEIEALRSEALDFVRNADIDRFWSGARDYMARIERLRDEARISAYKPRKL